MHFSGYLRPAYSSSRCAVFGMGGTTADNNDYFKVTILWNIIGIYRFYIASYYRKFLLDLAIAVLHGLSAFLTSHSCMYVSRFKLVGVRHGSITIVIVIQL
jgi:hypothetical protein